MGDHLEYWPREVGFTAQPKLGKVDLDSWLMVQQMKGNFPIVNQDFKKIEPRERLSKKQIWVFWILLHPNVTVFFIIIFLQDKNFKVLFSVDP